MTKIKVTVYEPEDTSPHAITPVTELVISFQDFDGDHTIDGIQNFNYKFDDKLKKKNEVTMEVMLLNQNFEQLQKLGITGFRASIDESAAYATVQFHPEEIVFRKGELQSK